MYNHEPKDYVCPFCLLVAGQESKYNRLSDIVYQDDDVMAIIAPKWWANNHGHVLVIPKKHVENIYDISDELIAKVYVVAKKMAVGLKKAYGCDGTSTRQHNEPDGGQDVWHFHAHVFPRYKDDHLYELHDEKRFVGADESKPYADKLKAALS